MRFSTIVFDIDGTLIDTEQAVLLSLQDTIFANQKRTVEISELRFAFGIPGEEALKQLGFDDLEYYNSLWDAKYREYRGSIRIFDGIASTLKKLKENGTSLGIITSKTRKEYQSDFLSLGLEKYFGTIICAEDSRNHKPSSEPMEKFLERSGAVPDEVLYIGDTQYDLQCAKGANVSFGLALWGCSSPENIAADYFFQHPKDILMKSVSNG